MLAFSASIAVIGHPFRVADPATYQMQFINFMKNVAIKGGFLAVFVAGPGSVGLDTWFFRRR